jgi:hypothetical protein
LSKGTEGTEGEFEVKTLCVLCAFALNPVFPSLVAAYPFEICRGFENQAREEARSRRYFPQRPISIRNHNLITFWIVDANLVRCAIDGRDLNTTIDKTLPNAW